MKKTFNSNHQYMLVKGLWEEYSKAMENDGEDEAIENCKSLVGKIETLLPFENEEEHNKKNKCGSYKD